MAVVFDEMTRRLLDGKNFATVATINPDGGPQASVRLPRAVSQKYLGKEPEPEPAAVTRVIVRIRPERINTFRA